MHLQQFHFQMRKLLTIQNDRSSIDKDKLHERVRNSDNFIARHFYYVCNHISRYSA